MSLFRVACLLSVLALLNSSAAGQITSPGARLQSLLSHNASIAYNTTGAPRWSEFDAPSPGFVVNVATENDVQVTVQFATQRGIPFIAQSGGHGWISTFHLYQDGIIINMAGLKSVTFSPDRTRAYIQGGALDKDVVEAAYANNAQVVTGNCNCVSIMGAGLGGGYGNLKGIHGFIVDNIISMNVVLANGSLVTVTAAQEDLFWALRGAGPNFGIVTSAVMTSYPVLQAQSTAWFGGLAFTDDKVEALAQAIQNLTLQPKMSVFQYYLTTGAPSYTPFILITPFYLGSAAEGKAAFASVYALGPFQDTTSVLPYNEWNAAADGFCIKGGRKPSYSVGFQSMVPATWRAIWNEFIAFLKNPGTGSTVVLVEAYSLQVGETIPASSTSFSNRNIRFNSAAIPWYANKSLDAVAEGFGCKVRELLRSTDGLPQPRTYVNFAHGDESNEVIYFDSTPRLRQLKSKYDPHNVFNHWFSLGA